jgi:hypothetical protein
MITQAPHAAGSCSPEAEMERGSSSEGYERIPPARRAAILSKAHSIFFYAVFGLVIALAAWLIVKAIVTGLGG